MRKPDIDLNTAFKQEDNQNNIKFDLMMRIVDLSIMNDKLVSKNNELFSENKELAKKVEILIQDLEIANENNKILQRALYGKKSERLSNINKAEGSLDISNDRGTKEENNSTTNKESTDYNQANNLNNTNEETQDTLLNKDKKRLTNNNQHNNRGRKAISKDLPRRQMIHDLPEAQKICSCGCSLTQIGSDKSEQIEYIPANIEYILANIVVIEHIRYKYACKECEETVRRAEVPHKPLPKSNATASLLAYTIISKFADHLPLYRQSKIWERFETYIPRATLSNWIIACSVKLSPLVSLLKEDLVKHDYICSDETPIRVLSQKNKAYMWVHISGIREHRVVIYDYQNNRSGDTGLKILENFSGYHQCDAYSGYNNFHLRDWIIYVGCWAHVRRKFYEIVKISKKEGVASSILKKIGKLYDLERWADQYNFSPEKRKELRLEKAVAILASIKEELDYYENLALPKGLLGRAIGYCLNNWDSLNTYLLDGKIRIDNNDCEGVIRLIALGRKNWLFCYTDNGARATSIMYSIIQTAVVNHLDLYPYLQYTIENIREGMEEAELREFLPYNFNKDNFLKAA